MNQNIKITIQFTRNEDGDIQEELVHDIGDCEDKLMQKLALVISVKIKSLLDDLHNDYERFRNRENN